ncbi:hypothetical protein HY041_01930 [Candidatus Roizmanbacteria bacterium]|nr:hypothetical protein [Candidatus Roizmanbacteria bacterium]
MMNRAQISGFIKNPLLLFFAVLHMVKEYFIKPNRKLRGSKKIVTPPQGTWKTAKKLPSCRYEFGAATLHNKIYVIGGVTLPTVYTVTRRVEVYDVVHDFWSRVASYPVIIHHPGVTSDGKNIYVV